ncbi:MAG: hypothetical protein J6W28_07100 [Clostridia bacterium]|nr:hypothetical protein [Clostridia bacterium]
MSNEWLLSPQKERTGRKITATLGIGGAVATLLVFSLLFFTNVRFTAEGVLSLSLHFSLLFFSSYVMYFSLFETGRDKGETEEETRLIREKRDALLSRYEKEGDTASLRLFCGAVEEKERREAQNALLSRFLITEEEATALLSRSPRSFKEGRCKRALQGVRGIRLTPAMLLSHHRAEGHRPPLSLSPGRLRCRRSLSFLFLTAVTAAFSVSLAFEVLLSPTAGTLAAYLLKLFTLFGSGLRGYKAGYFHATEDVTEYEREQAALLEEYFRTKQP